ncbi:odorant receptor 30a-like [Onthophagus taurus]|uniref:odorant receptor 30a-like n=1 Tax=Onthophagus taurus TaxID=166361 RepID=UPI0039BE5B24
MELKRFRSEIEILKKWKIWPENESELKYALKVTLQYSIITFPLLIGVINNIYHLLTENLPFKEILVNSVVPLTSINIFYSTPLLAISARKISKHLYELEDFTRFGIPSNHKKNLDILNKLIDFFRWSVRIGIILCTLIGYITQEKCKSKQLVSKLSTCGLFIDVRYEFDVHKSPIFEVYLIYQCVSLCISYDIAVHVGCLISVGNLVLCNMLDHLKSMICDGFTKEFNKKTLIECIQYHVHIIRLCDQHNQNFKQIVLVLMLSLHIFIGVPAFVFIMTFDLKALVILFCWIIGLGLGPYLGQLLIDKSTEISYVIYDVNWYDLDVKTQKLIYFIILNAQKELKCTSSNSLYTLNFEAIKQTLIGAYNYIALLYTLLNK